MGKYVFGADIGGTTIKMGLFTADGTLLDDWEIKTRTQENGKYVLSDVANTVLEKLASVGASKDDVMGIGLDAPGPILDDGTIKGAVNIGWGTFNIVKELESLTGMTVKAGNDANVAALGEMWKGGGEGYSDICMVTLGTGLGGGLVLGGKIRAGANGAAAEIGHIPFVEPECEPDICGCGKRGCLEQYTSATGEVRVAKRYLAAHPEKKCGLRDISDFTTRDIFDLVKAHDETASEIAELIYKYLGRGLATIAAVVDVEAFVIGGGVSKAGEIITDGVRKYYVEYAFPATRGADFKLAKLGNKAGIYGAAKLIIG